MQAAWQAGVIVQLDHRYQLSPKVKLRRERFGALLYDRERGHLYSLSPPLVAALSELILGKSLGEVLETSSGESALRGSSNVVKALEKLERIGVIDEL